MKLTSSPVEAWTDQNPKGALNLDIREKAQLKPSHFISFNIQEKDDIDEDG